MTIRYEETEFRTVTVITADGGKQLRRKGTEELFGTELWLGYSHYINGVLQDPPHLDAPEDFEEVDIEEEPVVSSE